MKQLIIFLMAGLFMCFQPFDVNSYDIKNGKFTLTNGTIELTCDVGSSWFGGSDDLEGKLTDGKDGLDGVVIKFYRVPKKSEVGDFKDAKGRFWKYMGETKTKKGGKYSFDDPDDNPTAGNEFYLQCDYVEGSGTA